VLGNPLVAAALADPEAAALSPKVKATLRLLTTVTKDHAALTAADVAPLLAAGVTPDGVRQALDVAWCFNVITRLADAFEFHVGPAAAFESSAKMLLTRGYKM
jgi:alkylhydroperoxidase family enzyme